MKTLPLSLIPLLLMGAMGSANATITTIPQSVLQPSTGLYTDSIGGGIGSIVVMTGGGNASGIGDPTGRNDDGFSGPIPLGFTTPLNFFGINYTSFFANNNGNLSFTGGNAAFIPTGPIGATIPTIAAFFGDVDTRSGSSGVMHLRTDIPNEVIVTWDHVGYFNSHSSPLNTFQIVLRSSDFAVPTGEGNIGFFYGDMGWTHTDTSTTSAVGFGDGAGNGEIIAGSNSQSDLHTALNNHHIWFDPNLAPITVPEPGSLALFSIGMAGIGAGRRKKI